MFARFRNKNKAGKARRERTDREIGLPQEAVEPLDPGLEAALKRDVASTMYAPVGDAGEAWNWVMERLRFYRDSGVQNLYLLRLQINVVENLFGAFSAHVNQYLDAVGSNTPIMLVCNRRLQQGNPAEAQRVAAPYLQYLDEHPELFEDGHLELTDEAELALYEAVHGKIPEGRLRPDGIVLFLLLNEQIRRSLPLTSPEEMDRRCADTERRMQAAAKLSPCDARIWLELARSRQSSDTPAFRSTVRRAMEFALEEHSLGEAYAIIAMSRLKNEPQLSSALCTMAQVYGEMAIAPRYVLNKLGVPPTPRPAAEKLVRAAGIQIGLSELARTVLQNTGR